MGMFGVIYLILAICGVVGLVGAIFEERAYWRKTDDRYKKACRDARDLLK
jgi:hypothetical protein